MEIKNVLNGLNPYEQSAKLEKAEGQQVKSKRDSTATSANTQGDRVRFSDEALLRTEAFQSASSTSDVRQDKVAEIKARIAAGEYQVDSRKIAENLIRDEIDLS